MSLSQSFGHFTFTELSDGSDCFKLTCPGLGFALFPLVNRLATHSQQDAHFIGGYAKFLAQISKS